MITAVLGALLYLVVYVIPLNGLVIIILLLLTLCLLFSLISYFINFTVYPVVERYLIKPYEKKMEEEKKMCIRDSCTTA